MLETCLEGNCRHRWSLYTVGKIDEGREERCVIFGGMRHEDWLQKVL
jgi:hypothetical protein